MAKSKKKAAPKKVAKPKVQKVESVQAVPQFDVGSRDLTKVEKDFIQKNLFRDTKELAEELEIPEPNLRLYVHKLRDGFTGGQDMYMAHKGVTLSDAMVSEMGDKVGTNARIKARNNRFKPGPDRHIINPDRKPTDIINRRYVGPPAQN